MRRDLLGLLLVVLVLFAGLAAIGVVLGPATSTETRYAEMGREMLVSGDWIVPKLNGAPLLEKPPFEYWVNAASFAVFGVNDLAARIPSLVAGLLTLLVVAAGTRRFAPASDDAGARRTRGLIAAFALATMPAFLIQAYTISIDIWLVLVTTVAGLCVLESVRTNGRPGLRWVLLLHGAMGVGMLVKGPLTLALVGIAAVILAVVRWNARPLRPFGHPAGVLLFFALALPWYLAADARIENLLRDLVSRRLFGGIKSSLDFHPHAVWIVWLPFLGTFPWLATLPGAVGRLFARGGWRAGPALGMLLLALSAPALFSISKSRLVSYSSPAFPWLAMLVALGWPLGSSTPEEASRARGHLARATLGTAAVALGLTAYLFARARPSTLPAVLAALGAALAVGTALLPHPRALFARPLPRIGGVAVGLLATIAAITIAEPFRVPAARPLWDAVARVRKPGEALGVVLNYEGDWGLFPWNAKELVTYFDYPTTAMVVLPRQFDTEHFRTASELRPWFDAPERRFLLMRKRDAKRADYLADATTYTVAEGGLYIVVTNHPLAPAGS